MNLYACRFSKPLLRTWVGAIVAAVCGLVEAAPGAHGPNGEHLDEKTQSTAGAALPRVEAKSELFELIAQLKRGELSVLVDRYETNEPVLNAKLDVESGTLKATAAFRAEAGDYVVTDAALLKALATPGEHALVFTLVASADADLLDGTLVTGGATAAASDHGHSHDGDGAHDHGLERAAWIGAAVLALGLLGGVGWWRQRRRERAAVVQGVAS
jgi:hypothetical protein